MNLVECIHQTASGNETSIFESVKQLHAVFSNLMRGIKSIQKFVYSRLNPLTSLIEEVNNIAWLCDDYSNSNDCDGSDCDSDCNDDEYECRHKVQTVMRTLVSVLDTLKIHVDKMHAIIVFLQKIMRRLNKCTASVRKTHTECTAVSVHLFEQPMKFSSTPL